MRQRTTNTTILSLLLATGSLGYGGSASAAEPADALGEQTFFAELPLVVTVTRLPQEMAEVPASVTVIDREMIDASGVEDIPSLFRLAAGIQVGHDADHYTSVTYHGVSDAFARRMQVLVDGRSIYTPLTGGVIWPMLPISIDDIQRIEITRGPNGVAYGANSVVGVINIITYKPQEVAGTTARAIAGDRNYKRLLAREAGQVGGFGYRFTVERQEDDGPRDLDFNHNGGVGLYNNSALSALTMHGDYRPNANDTLTLQLGYKGGEQGYGRASDPVGRPPRDAATSTHYEQLRWQRILSSDEEFTVQIYHDYYELKDKLETPLLSDILGCSGATPPAECALLGVLTPDQSFTLDSSLFVHRYNAEVQYSFRPATDLRLVWGAEARLDETRAPGYYGSDDTQHNHLYRMFANGEWSLLPRWTANVGVMVERDDLVGTRTSPRLALNHRYDDNHYLRASYTVAYRTPSMFEEYVDYQVRLRGGLLDGTLVDSIYQSPNELKPEKMESYELGFGGVSEDRRFTYELKLFHEQLTDLVTAYSAPLTEPALLDSDSVVFANDGLALVRGFEAQVKLRPSDRTMISLAYSHATTYGQLREELTGTEQYMDLALTTPSDTLSLLISHSLGSSWQGSLGLYHVTDTNWIGGDATGGITTADIVVRKNLKALGAEGGFTITVRDFIGAYYDYINTVYQERRLFMGVDARF